MGDVVSISRVSDVDIFKEFESQCPQIPQSIDLGIPRSAGKSVGQAHSATDQRAFRKHCAIVIGLSVCILVIVKIVSGAIAANIGLQYRSFESNGTSHRETKADWRGYIQQLERDPIYKRVVKEQQLYLQNYPE